jgi:ferredoxin
MAYIITSLCVDCKDTACADVCPVECIYEEGGGAVKYQNQLYIHPDECIDCTNCEPACPWKAIFEEDEVPALFKSAIAENAAIADDIGSFIVAKVHKGPAPTADQVAANFKKHSYTP